ncbi:MAG: hypothetical protein V2A77_07820 [Pseudomonadota bacterium]
MRGRYYIGRVAKRGILDVENLTEAICRSAIVGVDDYRWTITDAEEGDVGQHHFIFGKLAKYSQDGHITIVDSKNRSQVDAPAPNLLIASSPFVYLPTFSGIAYLHVWNVIERKSFQRIFKNVVEAKYENFFAECDIDPITDLRAFAVRVADLTDICEISAKVHPPNPLFGRFWKKLDAYIKRRNAEEVSMVPRCFMWVMPDPAFRR